MTLVCEVIGTTGVKSDEVFQTFVVFVSFLRISSLCAVLIGLVAVCLAVRAQVVLAWSWLSTFLNSRPYTSTFEAATMHTRVRTIVYPSYHFSFAFALCNFSKMKLECAVLLNTAWDSEIDRLMSFDASLINQDHR